MSLTAEEKAQIRNAVEAIDDEEPTGVLRGDMATQARFWAKSNGAVYYGHLFGYGGPQPVMTEVYYVASQTNPETKQTNNILVKRGKELHEPDRMYLNPNQIVLVEPVGTTSRVAQLIAQAK